ncbi:GTPase [Bacillus sp. B1-b2]|uniref:GTPase n=1 Tax=Bacillus sp. B1-b2 TaxID=2653201 RepID=UPI0012617C64|nr:GTPase domain-containing protein [Bacillus sp. B1-b2]KAB7672558.1 hypothetical protein F9279_02715 [Bacillus sp. B1-b2]
MSKQTATRYKDIFQYNSNEVLESLKEFHDLSDVNIDDEKLKENLSSISEEVASGIDRIQMNLNFLIKNVEWDTFNIAFFGETNAGKSTIIEALTNGDGTFIGDGRKDFTKKMAGLALNDVKLLDLPGIEGNERKFISEIKRGIEKAHIIFYVIGTNKEPEYETIKKIRSFLRDQAKVYSIINVRGKPSVYRHQKELISDSILTIESRTKEKFREILGEHYEDNIILNGHLAFLSKSTPKRDDFVRDQQKLKDVFGSLEEGYEFCNLKEVEKLLSKLSLQSKKEIAISNTYKYMSTVESIIGRILKGKKEFDREIKNMQQKTDEAVSKAEVTISQFHKNILSSVDIKIDQMKSNLQKIIYEGIDNEYSESLMKSKLHAEQRSTEKEIKRLLEEQLEDLRYDITNIFKQLQKRIDLEFKFRSMGTNDFNVQDIIKKMEISMGYVMEEILDVGLSVIGIILMAFNPILAVIGGIIAVLRKIWDWFFSNPNKRKREAKGKAYDEVKNTVNALKFNMRKTLNKEMDSLQRDVKKQVGAFGDFIYQIRLLSLAMDDKIRDLQTSKVKISQELTSFVEDVRPSFSYFDLKLKQAMFIGVERLTWDIYRLEKVDSYDTIGDFFTINNFQIKDGYLYITENNEFMFRSSSILIDHCKKTDYSIPIKGVRRSRL